MVSTLARPIVSSLARVTRSERWPSICTCSLPPTCSRRLSPMSMCSSWSTRTAVVVHGDVFIVVHRFRAVALDVHRFIAVDSLFPVIADPVRFVVLDFDALVFFRMQPQLFRILAVFEAQGVGVRGGTFF